MTIGVRMRLEQKRRVVPGVPSAISAVGVLVVFAFVGCDRGDGEDAIGADADSRYSSQGIVDQQIPYQKIGYPPAHLRPEPGTLHVLPPRSLPTQPTSVEGNRLQNGGFEAMRPSSTGVVPNWALSLSDGQAADVVDDYLVEGSQACRVILGEPGTFSLHQDVQLDGHAAYLLRFYALVYGSSGAVQAELTCPAGKHVLRAATEPVRSTRPAVWTVGEAIAEVPAYLDSGTFSIVYEPGLQHEEHTEGYVWLDDLELLQLGSLSQGSLLDDPLFESLRSGGPVWRQVSGAPVTVVPVPLGPGARAVSAQLSGDAPLRVDQKFDGLIPGARYTLRGYVKTDSVSGHARIDCRMRDALGERSEVRTGSVSGSTDWTWLSAEFVVPAGITESTLVLLALPDEKGGGTVWFARPDLVPTMEG